MSRSSEFEKLGRLIAGAEPTEGNGLARRSRRRFLRDSALALGALTAAGASGARNRPAPRIAIIGGGLAGLTCADRLRAKGFAAAIYEASNRVGGRCFSLRGYFPGQIAELGGEFIDTGHKTMLNYAREFGLLREDVTRGPGETSFYVNGQHYSEAEVVAEYRELVPRMRADLQTLSGSPTFYEHTLADEVLDYTDLATYLSTRAADLPVIRDVLDIAYVAEYGLETSEQSCLNFLLFIHADRRSKFTPFGVFSDERYHIRDGNDAIAEHIADRLPGPIEFDMNLVRLGINGFGEYEMRFDNGEVRTSDAVVLAIPFTVLRGVIMEPSLGLSADKLRAINELGYGNNAKTMLGFTGRPWLDLHDGNGETLADLTHVQNTWETNPADAGVRSILTDYSGGNRGRDLANQSLATRVAEFLGGLESVYPGISARYSGLAQRKHWPSHPFSLGSYTCYKPGQFTTIAGLEGEPAGRLKFAGEHADSFYSWQGFMEGACLSGIRAANEVLADIRDGVIP